MLMRAVFLDRDGVINQNRPDYVKSWEEVVFLPGVFESLRRLANTSYKIIVISNQSAVHRGLVAAATVEDIHRRITEAVESRDGRIDAFVYCPHRPDEECDCRKPRAGMLLRSARWFSLDLTQCHLIGDAVSDVQAAWAVGCQPILVQTGRGRESLPMLRDSEGGPTVVVEDLSAAVDWILSRGAQPHARH
jgi:D-glycero-D-manno-heptose 1,7-bisphosphate phosphatase